MNKKRAEKLAHDLLDREELRDLGSFTDWSFKFNKRRVHVGVCNFEKHRIELSVYFVENNDKKAVEEILLHEIAHAKANCHGHGKVWQEECKRLGIEPKTTYKYKTGP